MQTTPSGVPGRSTGEHDQIWVEQDANARAMGYFEGKLTTQQRTDFDNAHEHQNYYDHLFLRNYLSPHGLTLLIIDITWSN